MTKRKAKKRRMMFYIAVFAVFFTAGYMIGKIDIPKPVEAEQAFIIGENEPEKTLKSLGTYTITAYCPCRSCSGKWGRQTASGVTATPNHTIAAPKNIPFGTILVIDGVPYTVEDRGGAIRGRKLDIFMESHSECKKWGKQRREVFIYE